VILVGSYPQYSSQADPNNARITYSLRSSRLQLPVVGGTAAAHAAGL
jgi:X-Pro dipeptidyl-peptidase